MDSIAKDNISYRLLDRLSDLVICSSCLRNGIVTPVPQLISGRHALTNECVDCRSRKLAGNRRSGNVAWLHKTRH